MWLFGDRMSTRPHKCRFSSSVNPRTPPFVPHCLQWCASISTAVPLRSHPILILQQSPLFLFVNYMTKSGLLFSSCWISNESSGASINLRAPAAELSDLWFVARERERERWIRRWWGDVWRRFSVEEQTLTQVPDVSPVHICKNVPLD